MRELDEATATAILDKYQALIGRVLSECGISPAHADYDDLTQELRLRLLKLAQRSTHDPLTEGQSFGSYAKRGLTYMMKDYLRKRQRKQRREGVALDDSGYIAFPALTRESPEPAILLRMALDELATKLSAEERLLFELLYRRGWSVQAVAERMQVSPSTIYRRKHKLAERVLEALRSGTNL